VASAARRARLSLPRHAEPRLALRRLGLTRIGRACMVSAAVACLAGCVSMPSSGPVGSISATPQSTAAGGDFIEPFPSPPQPNESPTEIVNGFLAASASYPVNSAIAKAYLVGAASRKWNPGWSVTVLNTFTVLTPSGQQLRRDSRQAAVDVSGSVQSSFNGSGQFVSAQGQGDAMATWHVSLVKVDGQWRISNPPDDHRLLSAFEFTTFYNPQDLYFGNPNYDDASTASSLDQALVPDSVFVPVETSRSDLVKNLVTALLPTALGNPQSKLLQNAAATFPSGTKLESVTVAGTTAVVNLGGLTNPGTTVLKEISAQLVWTLASPRAGPPSGIQSVELELNGKPWIPPKTICGITQSRSFVQNQATYPCYNPYPSQPASFSFAGHGQLWSRCSSEASAQRGLVGPVVSVFQPASAANLKQCAGGGVATTSTATPASSSLAGVGTPSMVAVSPDGNYVACYSPDEKKVFTGLSSAPGVLTSVQGGVIGPGVTALSWDRNDDLWIAQGGDVFMLPVKGLASGKAIRVGSVPAGVTDLSVAPDGVRIALIVQDGSGTEVDLAATSSQEQQASIQETASIGPLVQVGPDLTDPDSLAWYDADDLIVLSGGSDETLSEVPVDSQQAFNSQPAPQGAYSITASGSMNALVAGLSGQRISVSTSLEGPWQPLSVHGQNPAYPG
jgi:Lipoprotein LpqB beta-propeller domain/Sporulation and spore germination